MSAKVVPLPLWRSTRRTGVLLAVLGTLVLLFGIGMISDSSDLEAQAERDLDEPAPAPSPSTSTPPNTSS